jgi:serine/threonine-protein kinase
MVPTGRYQLFSELACGGMAMVYLGQLEGVHGFKRPVAIKRMHAQYARDPEFSSMFLEEARLVAKIRHPNVVPTLDVVTRDEAALIVMEFVEGESVARLVEGGPVPPSIAAAIAHDTLCGLHAAHELTDDDDEPLGVIHRDVSPTNILVGKDGLARILDFGIAKAAGRSTTNDGSIKGKVPYMPPEQLWGSELDRTVDVYSVAVVLWEMLTGSELFKGGSDMETMKRIVEDEIVPPSAIVTEAAPLDGVVMRGLSRDPSKRFRTALEMAKALEEALAPATRLAIADWVMTEAGESIARRRELLRGMRRQGAPVAQPRRPTAPKPLGLPSASRKPRTQAPLGVAAGFLLVLGTVAGGLATRASTARPSPGFQERGAELPLTVDSRKNHHFKVECLGAAR